MVKSCGVGGLCDFGVTPVPIGLGFGFGTALGFGLGLRGPNLGLGLDNYLNRFVIDRHMERTNAHCDSLGS